MRAGKGRQLEVRLHVLTLVLPRRAARYQPALAAAASPRLHEFKPQDVANSLWALARLGASADPGALTALGEQLVKEYQDAFQLRLEYRPSLETALQQARNARISR